MCDVSLFELMKVPKNPEMLAKWSERIKNKILEISEKISKFEKQKQNCLNLLFQANIDYDPVPPPSPNQRSSSVSVIDIPHPITLPSPPHDVIDLVSEPPTPVLNPDTMFTPSDVEEFPLNQETLSPPEIPIGEDIGNLRLSDLSFHPGDPVAPPPRLSAESHRVLTVREADSIDWGKVEPKEIKEILSHFGIKNIGGRNYQIKLITNIFNYLTNSTTSISTSVSDDREDIPTRIRQVIRTDDIYNSILCFEPIDLNKLNSVLISQSIRISRQALKEFCDSEKIQYIKDYSAKRKALDGMEICDLTQQTQIKMRRKLRRSLTAP
jgi:hypothetical protein